MRTEQLLYLAEIDKYASLHKASEAIHISPQALSLSMQSLEKELGFPVLERSFIGVTLTEKGALLLKAGNEFLNQVNALQEVPVDKYASSLSGSLTLAVTNAMLETYLPSVISKLYTEYPSFQPHFEIMEYPEILTALTNQNNTLGLIYTISVNDESLTEFSDENLIFQPIVSGKYACIAQKNYPAVQYKQISLKTLANYPFILYSPSKSILLRLFDSVKKSPKIVAAETFSIYRQFLKTGTGAAIAFVPDDKKVSSDKTTINDDLKIIPLKEHVHSTLGYVYRKDCPPNDTALAFAQFIQDCFSNL